MKFKYNYKDIDKLKTLQIIHRACVDAVNKGNKVDIVIKSK